MSHFSVLVIGDNLAEQLQPYHEFECTGIEDQYVQDVDRTEELRKSYQKGKTLRLKDPDGKLHSPWSAEFYREQTPEEHAEQVGTPRRILPPQKVRFVPDGWEELNVPYAECMSFREYVHYETEAEEVLPGGRGKYRWTEVTDLGPDGEVVRVIDRTNPNKQWDWWVVGGRWSNFLILKDGSLADSAKLGEIDWQEKRDRAAQKASEDWQEVHDVIAGREWKLWPQVLEEYGKDRVDEAREFYHSQEVVKDWKKLNRYPLDSVDDFAMSEEEYIKEEADQSCQTFAVVKDSQWYERGDMGWWGVVRDEKERVAWTEEFRALLDGVDETTRITVVDCHI